MLDLDVWLEMGLRQDAWNCLQDNGISNFGFHIMDANLLGYCIVSTSWYGQGAIMVTNFISRDQAELVLTKLALYGARLA
jgi:hypothetical protein